VHHSSPGACGRALLRTAIKAQQVILLHSFSLSLEEACVDEQLKRITLLEQLRKSLEQLSRAVGEAKMNSIRKRTITNQQPAVIVLVPLPWNGRITTIYPLEWMPWSFGEMKVEIFK
jgi:hypothetical protein